MKKIKEPEDYRMIHWVTGKADEHPWRFLYAGCLFIGFNLLAVVLIFCLTEFLHAGFWPVLLIFALVEFYLYSRINNYRISCSIKANYGSDVTAYKKAVVEYKGTEKRLSRGRNRKKNMK